MPWNQNVQFNLIGISNRNLVLCDMAYFYTWLVRSIFSFNNNYFIQCVSDSLLLVYVMKLSTC